MNIDITPIANALIALCAAVITVVIIPWFKAKRSTQERQELLKWVEIAVSAAQQLYHEFDGKKRKEYVLDFLESKGYSVDELEIDAAIEAAVLKLHQQLESEANTE